ncbi:MAG: RDD family protein [Planctomycetota bacterium]
MRTPEGIDLRFQTAAASERVVALALDMMLMGGALLVLGLLLGLTVGMGPVMLLVFVVRQGYFTWFESRWNGTTPGKRRFHLRVIRADGGPLTTEILLARNLTREIELFLPLIVIAVPQALFEEHSGVVRLVASLWVLLLLFFPLTNRHRLRIGDLLAGTRVVVSPPVSLLRDLADMRVGPGLHEREREFHFTDAQLGIYGVKELEVLEDVLRKARLEGGDATLVAVTKSICKRIGWHDEAAIGNEQGKFLRAFYAAQRRHLEQQLLFGKHRLKKANRPSGTGRPRQKPDA